MVLISIIVIISIILLFFYKKQNYDEKDKYAVRADLSDISSVKDISEEYQYPGCIGCTTSNQKLKPGYKYKISDDRCVKNNTTGYVDDSLTNLINYTQIPSQDLSSCYSNYNSLYSSIHGRYICLFRTDGTKIRFSHISVHERDTTKSPLSINSTIFTTNRDSSTYPESVLNIDSPITFEGGTLSAKGYPSLTIITLNESADIGYVNIKHINETDAATLDGAYLIIANDVDGDTVPPSIGQIVFYTQITGIDLNRIIYTYNHLNTLESNINSAVHAYNGIMPIVNGWRIPCTNCSSMTDNLFMGHFYMGTNDPRCYKPVNSDVNKSVIDTGEITGDVLTTSFITCNPPFDTRYLPASGKFIQISRYDNRPIGIKISKIQLYSDFGYTQYNLNTELQSLSALVNTYFNDTSLFGNVLDDIESSNVITTNDANSKIFIDIGTTNNIIISGIGLKIPMEERFNIVGLKICVISVDETDIFNIDKMTLSCEKRIIEEDVNSTYQDTGDTLTYTLLIPLSNNGGNTPITNYSDIVIHNNVLYDNTNKYKTTYKKGITYYQIPYTIYTMPNGRSIMAQKLSNSVDTLDKIIISDAVTLFNFSSNSDMKSVPGTINSQLLIPITARYIQITSTQNLTGVFQNVELFDSNSASIGVYSNPSLLYIVPQTDYTNYLTTSSTGSTTPGFILIDFGSNKTITFIRITINASVLSKANGAIFNLIDSTYTKKYTYTFSNPTSTVLLITDQSNANAVGPHFLNKFDYLTCLSANVCNIVASNNYYILNDGRCFKSKQGADPDTCTNCMTDMPLFTRSNQISTIVNNFESCDPSIDTRYFPSPILSILLVGGGGGGGDVTGMGKSLRVVGGSGGAGEVVEILNKIVDGGTSITMTIGKYGHALTDYYAYGLPVAARADIDGISGRSGQQSTITIGSEPMITALGGGAGGCGGRPGLDGGSGGGAGSGNYTPGKSIAKQPQQDGKATGAPSIGGGSALAGTVSDTRDGRTSSFIDAIGTARLYSTTLLDYANKPADVTSQYVNGPNTTDGHYYVASAAYGKGSSSMGGGGGPTSYEARGGGVIIQSTTPAISHNAMATGKSGRLFYYAWNAASNYLIYKTDPPLTGFINF